jgi:hypothetical protein
MRLLVEPAEPQPDGLLMSGEKPPAWLLPVVTVPAALTGVTALAGLLSAETEAPCGKFCPDTSPDPSTEAWFVAFAYVGIITLLCLARFMAATPMAPSSMPKYRGSLGILGATSLMLAIITPSSWEPLQPALIVGGLSGLAFLIVGGCLATVGRAAKHARVSPPAES